MILKKTKNNYLIVYGIIFFVVGFVGTFLTEPSKLLPENYDRLNNLNFFLLLAGGVFAPIFEELAFRSVFTGRKFTKYFFYFGVGYYLIIYTNNYYLIFFELIFIYLYEIKKMRNHWMLFVLSSLIFSLAHYRLEVLTSTYQIASALTKFGTALFLVWIVVNFSIVHSILLHSFINTSMLLLFVYNDINGDQYIAHKQTENFNIKIKQVSVFNKTESFETDNKSSFVNISNGTYRMITDQMCQSNDEDHLEQVVPIVGRFDITISPKNPKNKKKISCKEYEAVYNMLLTAEKK